MALNETQLPVLSKALLIAEKIIAVGLVLWGMYALYNVVAVIVDMVNSGYIKSRGISYWQVARENHLAIIVSLLNLFGGFLLLSNDKSGWLLSIISTFMTGIGFFIASRSNTESGTMTFVGYYKSYGIVALIFFIIFLVLLLKPFREKYRPTSKNWFWMITFLGLLIIDKALL